MKYAILVCDGASDWKIPELGNKTIFEAAKIPNMDFMAANGRMGLLKTIPDSMKPGSECANMTIMGYNPETELTGRGPLEALSSGVEMSKTDLAYRCNLITIKDGLIKDYSSGHITTEESKPLIKAVDEELGSEGVRFFPGVQYRHILRLNGNRFSEDIELTPPHDELDQPYTKFLVKPDNPDDKRAVYTADYMNTLIEKSRKVLLNHPINEQRREENKNQATNVWFWSGGKKPNIEPFKEKYGLTGSVISAVDLIFGLGIAAGLEPIHIKGATGLPDTNYEGKATAGIESLKERDFVFIHVEATDEMGHAGDYDRKKSALEDFDRKIVKPFLEAEKQFDDQLVICVLPDHPTPCEIRTHSREAVPFVIYNPHQEIGEHPKRKFTEENGKGGELGQLETGEAFMTTLLGISE